MAKGERTERVITLETTQITVATSKVPQSERNEFADDLIEASTGEEKFRMVTNDLLIADVRDNFELKDENAEKIVNRLKKKLGRWESVVTIETRVKPENLEEKLYKGFLAAGKSEDAARELAKKCSKDPSLLITMIAK